MNLNGCCKECDQKSATLGKLGWIPSGFSGDGVMTANAGDMPFLQNIPMPAPVMANPSEPLLLVPDILAMVGGLFVSSVRGPLWGAALVDIVGRQVSETYRTFAYQYVHSHFFK